MAQALLSMVALKGKPDIGDQINKKIIAPLADANKLANTFKTTSDAGSFGSGKEMVDTLGGLIAVFENPALDFSRNADGDDILGDAYEYLMRHFATESGKSKVGSTPRPKLAASWPRSSASATPMSLTTPACTTLPAAPARCY